MAIALPDYLTHYNYEQLIAIVDHEYPDVKSLTKYRSDRDMYKALRLVEEANIEDLDEHVAAIAKVSKPKAAALANSIKSDPKREALRQYFQDVNMYGTLSLFEQEWVNYNLMPLTTLMGHAVIAEMWGVTTVYERMRSVVAVPTLAFVTRNKKPNGSLDGATGHFYARRPGDTKDFDPYDFYQMNGTNQFCQTFSMMYACAKIERQKGARRAPVDYYATAIQALRFIRETIEKIPDTYSFTWINKSMQVSGYENISWTLDGIPYVDGLYKLGLPSDKKKAKQQMLLKVDECLRHYRACVNAIEPDENL